VVEACSSRVHVDASPAVQQATAAKAPLKRNVYEVNKLLARREGLVEDEFLVEWAGFPHDDASWEPRSHITQDVMRAFEVPGPVGGCGEIAALHTCARRHVAAAMCVTSHSVVVAQLGEPHGVSAEIEKLVADAQCRELTPEQAAVLNKMCVHASTI
jgi:hypothetical protein